MIFTIMGPAIGINAIIANISENKCVNIPNSITTRTVIGLFIPNLNDIYISKIEDNNIKTRNLCCL